MVNCVEQENFFPNINVLDAINTRAEIWTVNVKPSTISICFCKEGFVKNLGASSAECNDEDIMRYL
jgi:predicted HTH transcriptional regulator